MVQSRINPILAATVAALILAGLKPTPSVAQVVNREAELKGRLVGVLGGLVRWPGSVAPSRSNPLTIGIVGASPFVDGNGKDHLKAKVPTAVILNFNDAMAIKSCHILVVSRDADFKAVLAKVKGMPILLIAESRGLAKQGAAINLAFDQSDLRIRLEINPEALNAAGLIIDRGLLRSPLVDIISN